MEMDKIDSDINSVKGKSYNPGISSPIVKRSRFTCCTLVLSVHRIRPSGPTG